MFWVILIAGIIIYTIYAFLRDRDHMLQRQVDMHGGMVNKYGFLVEQMTLDPSARVVKVTRDHIHIRSVGNSTAINYFISENFNSVDIEWVAQMGMLGTHKHKWSFPHNYPQEKIVEEIGKFMEWKTQQIFGGGFLNG